MHGTVDHFVYHPHDFYSGSNTYGKNNTCLDLLIEHYIYIYNLIINTNVQFFLKKCTFIFTIGLLKLKIWIDQLIGMK
jgi:hypothetical protein